MYQALYRKWRPRTFGDVVGQEHITDTLRRQVESGRLSHAYLFVGTRGTGKTTCAKILAKAVNCEHPVNGEPCNDCPSCRGIDSGAILDVVELDAASNNGVDNVRALRDEAVFSPASVKKRVYIVDEVHMLSSSAFNALLKILEEPPEHLMFILATTEIHKVPATILSRCQRFTFKRILPADIASRLGYVAESEGLNLTADGAELLARLADGSMRDGLSLLDQCSSESVIDTEHVLASVGLAGADETAGIMDCAVRGDVYSALSSLDRLYSGGKEMSALLDEMLSLQRDALIMKLAPKKCAGLLSGSYETKVITDLAERAGKARLMSWLDITRASLSEMSRTSDRKLAAELCIMRLCCKELAPDIDSLRERVEKLEVSVSNGAPLSAPSHAKNDEARSSAPKAETAPAVPATDTAPAETEEPYAEEPEALSEKSAEAPPPAADVPQEVPASTETAADGDVWQSILSAAKPEMDIPPFLYLSEPQYTSAEVRGAQLCIFMKSSFMISVADTPAVNAALKKAAENVLGRTVTIKFSVQTEMPAQSEDKLDRLARFDNIRFE
ncbi:MAG: DNA polymerase III subunit gamma/tau [Oscillospiraceae bacterium]|nr:DNA polymerase III subunit gamma/tau [Oscillospiraceae bacterium]